MSSATCTINNNDQPATLTLVKTVTNDNGGTAVPTAWTLAAAGPTPISGTTGSAPVTNATVNAGTYTLSESNGPTGYTPSGWSCTGGTLNANILTLGNGQTATCSIDNGDVAPRLTLVKEVDNGTGAGTALARDWALTATGPVTITGLTTDASITAAQVQVGTYDLSEIGPPGYTPTSWICTGGTATTGTSVTLAAGSDATCTITNVAIAPQLTLVKTVTNDNGGAAAPGAWNLTATGPTTITGATGSGTVTDAVVQTGTYTLSESAGPSGYTAGAWTCVGATVTGTQITLGSGAIATCTINNDDQPARLTLSKVVDPGTTGSTKVPADWTLTATGATTITGPSGDPLITGATVSAGDYDLTESGPTGFTPGDWSCGAATVTDDTVTVPNGSDVTCSITNTAVAPQLTLIKTVDNANGAGNATVAEWTLTAVSPTTSISGLTGNAAVTDAAVTVGTYTLSETGPTGYTASAWVCTGGTTPTATTVTLTEGQDATCTITNTAIPATLTLVKNVVHPAGGTAVPRDWTLSATGPTTITGLTGDPAITAAVVGAGHYDLSESSTVTGYTASPWSCIGATTNTGTSVEIAAGQTVVCTITNTDVPALLTLVKVVDNGTTGATHAESEWTLTAASPTATITGATATAAVTDASVPAGTYTLTETNGPAGYDASDWVCTGALTSTSTSVTLDVGEDATCTITNTAIAPTLTLTKTVDNGAGFGTAVPADWALTAVNGASTITGASGTGAVTNAAAIAGTYNLTETGGPGGYTAGNWSCTGGTGSTATSVTLDAGSIAECTITNTAVAPRLTMVKTVTNDDGGTALPTAWTLTATGTTNSLSGTTGSARVTGQPVARRYLHARRDGRSVGLPGR